MKRAGLWAFPRALQCLDGDATFHTDNLGVRQGLWKGEEGCHWSVPGRCGPVDNNVYEMINDIIGLEWSHDVKHDEAHTYKEGEEGHY